MGERDIISDHTVTTNDHSLMFSEPPWTSWKFFHFHPVQDPSPCIPWAHGLPFPIFSKTCLTVQAFVDASGLYDQCHAHNVVPLMSMKYLWLQSAANLIYTCPVGNIPQFVRQVPTSPCWVSELKGWDLLQCASHLADEFLSLFPEVHWSGMCGVKCTLSPAMLDQPTPFNSSAKGASNLS